MKIRFLVLSLLSGCASAPAPREAPRISPLVSPMAAELDQAIGRAVSTLPSVPGLAVAVYTREGNYIRAFGVTDVTTRAPATADTVFYIASSTKPLTALAFASLDARRELDLDTTLAAYAPEAGFPAAIGPDKVTLRHLLTHTSGIENYPIGFRVAYSGDHDPERLWSLLAASKVNERAPFGTFRYTNVGYNIATILTDAKLGVRWQDLLAREIFIPAGMKHSSASMSEARAAGWSIARPHGYSPEARRSERLYLEKSDQTMQSAGGVIMSAADAARWLELLVEDGRIAGKQALPAGVVQSTRVPLADLDENRDGFTRKHYALGWYLGSYRDEPMIHHFGGFSGARAHVSYLPARHAGVAVFINDSSVSASLVDLVAKLVYDRVLDLPGARADFDAAVAALVTEGPARFVAARKERAARPWTLRRPRPEYAGTYESAEMGTMIVAVVDGEITANIGVLRAVATPYTEPESMRVEFAPGQGEVIRFEPGDGPHPVALTFGFTRFVRNR